MRRRDQRRAAIFALYEHEQTGKQLSEILGRDAHSFTRALAEQADARRAELDALIEHHSHGWALDRIAPVERSIMRVALLEITRPGELPGDEPIPPEGAIDEAVQTAKEFCGTDAPGFVNGVLGGALDDLLENARGDREAIVTRSPTALAQRLEDELLVLDPASERFVRLNETGISIWEALERPQSLAALAAGIARRYGIDDDRALADATAFVAALHARDLVSVAESEGA